MNKNVAIYYINLDRSEERNKNILQSLKDQDFGCDIHRISAVDGQKLDYKNLPEYMYDYREKYYSHLSLGEIACTLSHKKAFAQFLESDYEYAIILEDDSMPTPALKTLIEKIQTMKGWDVLKLENRKHKKKDLKFIVKQIDDLSIYVPKNITFCTLAIMYTKQGAKKVLKMNEKIYYAFDTQFSMSRKYHIKYLSVTPNLVLTSELESEIGHENNKIKNKNIFHKYRRRTIRLYKSIEKIFYQKQLYAYFRKLDK